MQLPHNTHGRRHQGLVASGSILLSGFLLLFSDFSLHQSESVQVVDFPLFQVDLPVPQSDSTTSQVNENPSHCWLNPPWGNNDTSLGQIASRRVCAVRVGTSSKYLATPFTTAKTLTCPNERLPLEELDHENITVVMLYYADPSTLDRQLKNFASYPEHLQEQFNLIIVDDGSPPGLQARECLTSPSNYTFQIRLVRVLEDIPWNMPGTQNLGFFLARTDKVLLLDLDTEMSPENFEKLKTAPLSNDQHPHIAHRLFITAQNSTPKLHPKILFMRKDTYFSVGGFDEDFSGHYGHTDYSFWFRFKLNPGCYFDDKVEKEEDRLHVHMIGASQPCEVLADTDTRKNLCEKALESMVHPPKRSEIPINKKIFQRRKFTQCWANHYIRFAWAIDL
jgi:hypothetical protein